MGAAGGSRRSRDLSPHHAAGYLTSWRAARASCGGYYDARITCQVSLARCQTTRDGSGNRYSVGMLHRPRNQESRRKSSRSHRPQDKK